jgi:hypothetical protein
MSSLEEPLGLGDLPKLSINRLGSLSSPRAYRTAAAADDTKNRKSVPPPPPDDLIQSVTTVAKMDGQCRFDSVKESSVIRVLPVCSKV